MKIPLRILVIKFTFSNSQFFGVGWGWGLHQIIKIEENFISKGGCEKFFRFYSPNFIKIGTLVQELKIWGVGVEGWHQIIKIKENFISKGGFEKFFRFYRPNFIKIGTLVQELQHFFGKNTTFLQIFSKSEFFDFATMCNASSGIRITWI